ncbi:MAG: hypothetical protein JO304_28025 [Solirubrobacterales bacterium]|nr:hypothetical protein [Solirubrobacterales bacterium]
MNTNLSTRRRQSIVALLVAATVFAAIAVFDLIAHPGDQGALRTSAEYILTATLIPAPLIVLWVLTALERLHTGYESLLGRVGLRIAAAGLVALVIDGVASLAGGSTDAAGPLYPIGMLATLAGIVLVAIHWYRTRMLPRWAGPTLAVGWFLGATPILGSGAAFLILAAAFLAIAVGLHRQMQARGTATISLDSSLAA